MPKGRPKKDQIVWEERGIPLYYGHRPSISFKIISDDYFIVNFRKMKEAQARPYARAMKKKYGEAVLWDPDTNCWNLEI